MVSNTKSYSIYILYYGMPWLNYYGQSESDIQTGNQPNYQIYLDIFLFLIRIVASGESKRWEWKWAKPHGQKQAMHDDGSKEKLPQKWKISNNLIIYQFDVPERDWNSFNIAQIGLQLRTVMRPGAWFGCCTDVKMSNLCRPVIYFSVGNLKKKKTRYRIPAGNFLNVMVRN